MPSGTYIIHLDITDSITGISYQIIAPLVIAPNDKHREKTIASMHECKARGGKIILIHEEGDSIYEEADISISLSLIHI